MNCLGKTNCKCDVVRRRKIPWLSISSLCHSRIRVLTSLGSSFISIPYGLAPRDTYWITWLITLSLCYASLICCRLKNFMFVFSDVMSGGVKSPVTAAIHEVVPLDCSLRASMVAPQTSRDTSSVQVAM